MIDTIGPGAVGTGAQGQDCGGGALPPDVSPAALRDALERRLQGADPGRPDHGAGPVNRILLALVAPDDAAEGRQAPLDGFRDAVVAELVRRYLLAVAAHAHGGAAAGVWHVVLDAWASGRADPRRIALAGAHAIVGHDLAPTVVSTCTLLGRTPGPAEREAVRVLVERVAARVCDEAPAESPGEAHGPELLLTRTDAWRQVELLWAVRGRPSEAEREQAALDWRAALIARGLLT